MDELSPPERYRRDGFLSPVDILDPAAALGHRRQMEHAERELGPLHYRAKIHTVLRSAFELATMARALDLVESLIGPDILLYNVTYIVKEPGTGAHVSWHQDLTYWGFDGDDQVSMWLALSAADETSGCMRMIPASHAAGRLDHELTDDESNVLFQGQTVRGVDERGAVACPLAPGQASFHHGWTLHASMPNRGEDRRIGLNVQYIATHVRQLKVEDDSAMLVRGEDRHRHYLPDVPAGPELGAGAIRRLEELDLRYRSIASTSGTAV